MKTPFSDDAAPISSSAGILIKREKWDEAIGKLEFIFASNISALNSVSPVEQANKCH
jgi:hypothetical protein